MLKVGLTGGYASGKSTIARELEQLGCHLIYADALGHQVLMPGGEAYEPAVRLFGKSILNADGTIDRKKLAAIVFNDAARLAELNALVHPAVFRLEAEKLQQFEAQDPHGIGVIEAAIMIESGGYKNLQRLIVAVCGKETQIERAMARDEISRAEAEARIARQLSDEERIRLADFVIRTDGTKEETLAHVRRVHAELRQLAEDH